MKKAIIATLAAVTVFGAAACKDRTEREVEVKTTEENRRFGDARPDNGHEGYFENDGIDDNTEGTGGSGHVEFKRDGRDNDVDVDAKVDHDRNRTDVDVEADKDDGKLQIEVK